MLVSTKDQILFLGNQVGDREQENGEEFWQSGEQVPYDLEATLVDAEGREGGVDPADEQENDDQTGDVRYGGRPVSCGEERRVEPPMVCSSRGDNGLPSAVRSPWIWNTVWIASMTVTARKMATETF